MTITKATSNPSPVTVTLTASDASDSFSSSLIVDLYDTPCDAAIGKGLKSNYPTDIAGDDCKVNLEDVAAIAAEWLESNALQAPQPK